MAKVTNVDKIDSEIKAAPIEYKIVASDLNNIKNAVNTNDDRFLLYRNDVGEKVDLNTSNKTSLVNGINENKGRLDTAFSDVSVAQDTADLAVQKADTAQSSADDAQTSADNAQDTADLAVQKADTAQSSADDAQTSADNAQDTADLAVQKADTAQSSADDAQTSADNAQSSADDAQTSADDANDSLNSIAKTDGYYVLNVPVGSIVGSTFVASTNSKTTVYRCSEGDVFTIKGLGASTSARLWAFADSSDRLISVANSSEDATENPIDLTAPVGAVKAYFNLTKIDIYPNSFVMLKSDLIKYVDIKSSSIENKADDAQTSADNAQDTADLAVQKADTAQSSADDAQTSADNAQSSADDAQTSADNAQDTADLAVQKADTAQSSADDAQTSADNAQDTADLAVQKADTAQSSADDAQTSADDANNSINNIVNTDGYYVLNVPIGSIVGSIFVASTNSKTTVYRCSEGDVFTIKGLGASTSARLWAFADSSDRLISVANSSEDATENPIDLTAPVGAVKAYFNLTRLDIHPNSFVVLNSTLINYLDAEIERTETKADNAQSKADSNESDINALTSRINTAESNISTNENDISTAQDTANENKELIDFNDEILVGGSNAYTHAKRLKYLGAVTDRLVKLDDVIEENRDCDYYYAPFSHGNGVAGGLIPNDDAANFSLTRASVSNYTNMFGDLRASSLNEPTIDWSYGVPTLLTQPTRTNYVRNAVNTGGWTVNEHGSGSTPTITTGYRDVFGTNNAVRVDFPADADNCVLNFGQTISSVTSGTMACSAYIKLLEPDNKTVRFRCGSSGSNIELNSTSFKRYSATLNRSNPELFNIRVRPSVGTSNGGFSIIVCFPQEEEGVHATNFITTTGADTTRLRDSNVGTGDISNIVNQVEGIIEIRTKPLWGENTVISLSDGTGNNIIALTFGVTDTIGFLFYSDGQAIATGSTIASVDINEFLTIKIKYKSGDVGVKVNDAEYYTSTDEYSNLSLDRFRLASTGSFSHYFGFTEYVKIHSGISKY